MHTRINVAYRIFETGIKILKNYMTLSRMKRLHKVSATLSDNYNKKINRYFVSGFIQIIYPDVREHPYYSWLAAINIT